MSGSMNRATIIGNLGRDPEIRTMQNGKKVASLSVATSESWRDRQTGERREQTEWHRVVIYTPGLVGVVEKYLKKGGKALFEGPIKTRKYTDQSGQERWTTEIVLSEYKGNLVLLSSANGGGAPAGQSNGSPANDSSDPASEPAYEPDDLDDDIPF